MIERWKVKCFEVGCCLSFLVVFTLGSTPTPSRGHVVTTFDSAGLGKPDGPTFYCLTPYEVESIGMMSICDGGTISEEVFLLLRTLLYPARRRRKSDKKHFRPNAPRYLMNALGEKEKRQ